MKMYMPLNATEAGTIRLIMQPGSVLESGALIAILTLDDPSRVRHARPFDGQLPKMGPPQSEDGKASSVFRSACRCASGGGGGGVGGSLVGGSETVTHGRTASDVWTPSPSVPRRALLQTASGRWSWCSPATTGRTRCRRRANGSWRRSTTRSCPTSSCRFAPLGCQRQRNRDALLMGQEAPRAVPRNCWRPWKVACPTSWSRPSLQS